MKRVLFLGAVLCFCVAIGSGAFQPKKLVVWAKSWSNPNPTFYAADGDGRSYILRLKQDASIECEPISLYKERYPISIENIDFGTFQEQASSLLGLCKVAGEDKVS